MQGPKLLNLPIKAATSLAHFYLLVCSTKVSKKAGRDILGGKYADIPLLLNL